MQAPYVEQCQPLPLLTAVGPVRYVLTGIDRGLVIIRDRRRWRGIGRHILHHITLQLLGGLIKLGKRGVQRLVILLRDLLLAHGLYTLALDVSQTLLLRTVIGLGSPFKLALIRRKRLIVTKGRDLCILFRGTESVFFNSAIFRVASA